MSAALDLLRQVQDAGGRIEHTGGDGLRAFGPLSSDLIEELRQHKAELLRLVSRPIVAEPGPGATPETWQTWFRFRIAHRRGLDYNPADTRSLAIGEALNRWHALHCQKPPRGLCAGCDGPLSGRDTFEPEPGVKVHYDSELACLAKYGERWRGEAVLGLGNLGIAAPEETQRG